MTTHTIEAPMPGVFYRRSNPDEPPYVEEGDSVEAGDVVALIGVMKNFYDVEAEVNGTVTEVLVENETEIDAEAELLTIETD